MTRAIGASAAYESLQAQYAGCADVVDTLRNSLLGEAPAVLVDASESELAAARAFVDDPESIFRFLRRNKFDEHAAASAVTEALKWRAETHIDSVAGGTLVSPYMSDTADHVPLFWMHSRFRDKLGRPCLHVALRHFERSPDGSLDELRNAIAVCLEVGQRYLRRVNRRRRAGVPPVLQLSLMLDVRGAGAANLELELLPYVRGLLRKYYPGLFGTVYVVHYSWMHSGIWRLAKPLFPESLLARLRMPDYAELNDYFGRALPAHVGGAMDLPMLVDSSDVFQCLGRSQPKRAPTERGDYESIYDVFSRGGTPYSTSRALTPMTSLPGTPNQRPISGIVAGIAPSVVAESLRELAEQDAQSGGDTWKRWAFLQMPSSWFEWPAWPAWLGGQGGAQAAPPDAEANDDVPPADIGPPAEAAPPATRQVSPYHPQNPYFGYPVTVVDPDADGAGTVARPRRGRRVHADRQKRHLLRTLLYLFMLRLLHIYRQLRAGIRTIVLSIPGIYMRTNRRRLTLTEALASSRAARATIVLGLLALVWPPRKAPWHLILAANSG